MDDHAVRGVDDALEQRVVPHLGEVVGVEDAAGHAHAGAPVAVAHLVLEGGRAAALQRQIAQHVMQHELVQHDDLRQGPATPLDEEAVDLSVRRGTVADLIDGGVVRTLGGRGGEVFEGPHGEA